MDEILSVLEFLCCKLRKVK